MERRGEEQNARGSVVSRGWDFSVWAWPLGQTLAWLAVPCGKDFRQAVLFRLSAYPGFLCSSWDPSLPPGIGQRAGEETQELQCLPKLFVHMGSQPLPCVLLAQGRGGSWLAATWHHPTWLSSIAQRSRVSREEPNPLSCCSRPPARTSWWQPAGHRQTGSLCPGHAAPGRGEAHPAWAWPRQDGWEGQGCWRRQWLWRELSILSDLCMSYLSILPDFGCEELKRVLSQGWDRTQNQSAVVWTWEKPATLL